jgi:hypothetical protein
MAEKSSTMLLKLHKINKQIIEVHILKWQAIIIRNHLSKLLNLFIQQQVIKIYARKNKVKCIRPITVLNLLTQANNSQETSKM